MDVVFQLARVGEVAIGPGTLDKRPSDSCVPCLRDACAMDLFAGGALTWY
jgi:hypothetical protein